MSELTDILEFYYKEIFLDEDENCLIVELREAASIEDISKFEIDNEVQLPEDLRKLLLFSNGLILFGMQINSVEEIEYFPQSKILTFHNWGNGDFDCLSVGGDYPKGTIVFMSHTENKLAIVSNSLTNWFVEVIAEIKSLGTLLHPLDYKIRGSEGMYKNILHQIDLKNDKYK